MTETVKMGYKYLSQTTLMYLNPLKAQLVRVVALTVAATGFSAYGQAHQPLIVHAGGFQLGNNISVDDGTNHLQLTLDERAVPYAQSAVKQDTAAARLGPDPAKPYFTVRFAMPIPPENATSNVAAYTGLDPLVFTHNHSPGFEILPNGDALAVYFSTPPGKAEADPTTSFIQARLRYGAEEWDLPELFFKFEGYNDQSGLLWNDNGTIRFFGGGRELSASTPFKMAASTNNGATWTLSLPQLDAPAKSVTPQPITSAFRAPDGAMYFAMDGEKAQSLLWRSQDNGVHWHDMGGRTSGRHSVIVPLDDHGDLLSVGGKNNSIEGWSPKNFSTNWGASWSEGVSSPFPPLGSGQRPSMIKLADGNLFFTSDAYLQKIGRVPPAGWQNGNGCFVAISTNQGATWHIKTLPVQVPQHERGTNGTLGYVTARQAPNGVIHILSTETQPCLQYELNEAWIWSDAGDIAPETSGGELKPFTESYPDGKVRSVWSARICPNGRYLLDGQATDFYENGQRQHQVTYISGCKSGMEYYWTPDGKKLWTWSHNLKGHRSTWSQYWPNGNRKSESTWNTLPEARALARSFFGMVAEGPVRQWDEAGKLTFQGRFVKGQFTGKEGL